MSFLPDGREQLIEAVDKERRPISRSAVAACLLFAGPVLAASALVGAPNAKYIDPEFEPGGTRMVFQDMQAVAWVGEIDPATGQCVTATCRDVPVASNVLKPSDTRYLMNGPEWGASAEGTALYLTRYVAQTNIAQSWRVNPDGTGLTKLTRSSAGSWGGMVSFAPSAPSVRVLASTDVDPNVSGVWFDETDGVLIRMTNFSLRGQGGRFFPDSGRYAIYPYKVGPGDIQIAILDTDLDEVEVVTTTSGEKTQPWIFDWHGVQHAIAVKDLAVIEVYASGPTPWPKVATLTPPVPGYLSSTEPLGNTGCFVTQIQDTTPPGNYTEAKIYVACLDGSTWTRVDDGAPETKRGEPEPWWSGNQWFIYYNVNDTALWVTDPMLLEWLGREGA